MPEPELTLDPSDWSAIRALGHQMIDDMIDHLGSLRERPAWREIPPQVKESFKAPVPFEGSGLGQAYAGFQERVLAYTGGNAHPRFWGWVKGSGSAEGMLAELLSAGLNINAGMGFDNPPAYVELQVLDWCRSLFGFPADSGAAIVSGGSMANFVALAVARDAAAGTAGEQGLRNLDAPLAFYCSDQTHNSVSKALRLLGLGREALRSVPTNAAYEIDLSALDRMIAEDRARGVKPSCIVGNAGTVNTGATDDLESLGAVAKREGMWFHVDGAFGAIAWLSPELRGIVRGIERADSLAFDFHKWLHVQYEAGGVLVRSAEAHKKPFAEPASYLKWMDRGYANGPGNFHDYAPELSRQFKALKIWIAFQSHGVDMYRRLAEQNVAQAKYLTGLVEKHANLELLAPTALNVVNFRYRRDGLSEDQLNGVNQEILMRLQEEGIAVPSGTMLRGKFAIRCAITNHRSRREDFDALAEAVVRIGAEIT